MSNHILPFIMFAISIIFLIIRLLTRKKRDFIISISFVAVGSGFFTFSNNFSVLYFFFLAIVFSLVGDLLMAQWIKFTEHRTIDGIMAFGLAHIIYIFAFNELNFGNFSFQDDWIFIIISIIIGILLFRKVASGPNISGELKFSNGIYTIIMMILLVFVLSFVFTEVDALYAMIAKISALVGVLLFITSDSILAYNEFQNELPHAKELIAVTYIFAQILLQLTPILLFL